MADSSYQVTLTGELKPGIDRGTAISEFCKMFKLSVDKGEQTFARAPVVIKKNVDEASATAFHNALEKIGLVAQIEQQGSPVVKPVESASNDPEPATASAAHTPPPAKLEQPGLKFEIEGQPDYSFLTVQLPAEQTLKVEASAMATMDTNITMKTKAKGGLGRLLTSESIFINEFTAEGGPGEVGIAPGAPGDLGHIYLSGNTVFLQNSAFVASGMDVETVTKWQGLNKGFFSGESFFLIRCSGKGDLWFNTYGGMIELDVDGGYVVDTGNIVGFTEGLEYKISKVGGYKSLFFSGEGFVCRFSGTGKVWIQTRSVQALTSWLYPFRPSKKG